MQPPEGHPEDTLTQSSALQTPVSKSGSHELQVLLARLDRLESTLHLALRTYTPRRRRIRCLFLVHHATAWPAIRGIVEKMKLSKDFEPVLMSLPHVFPILNRLGGESEVHEMFERQGFDHIRVRDSEAHHALDYVRALAPDIVFRQAPWDKDLPSCLSSSNLSFTRLCYVPYGYMTAAIEKYQFDQLYHRLCWRIFCPDEAHFELFRTHNLLRGLNCRVTGYPKFDHLLAAKDLPGDWPLPHQEGVFRLLWAPHFAQNKSWLNFGVFDDIAVEMLKLAASNTSIQIVLRPHPAMREAIQNASPSDPLARFMGFWRKLQNTAYSNEEEYAGLFAASHAMLTDGLSFFSEYQIFDRPLIFFEKEGHCGFNAAGMRLVPGMYAVHDFPSLIVVLKSIVKGEEDPETVSYRRALVKELMPFPGESAERILHYIREEMGDL